MLLHRLFRMRLGHFSADRRGNVAPIFALAMVPVIGFVGAAVDYSRAGSARTSMQSALDATALFLSREAQGLTPEQVTQKGQEYFDSIFHNSDAKSVSLNTQFEKSGGNLIVKVSATAHVDTIIARVLGHDQVPISSSSEVVWGMKRLELALVLDNTTSMASQDRMVELKKATKSLLETLKKAAVKPDDVKVAIIPYGTDVNVGPSNVGASWLDWGDGLDLASHPNRPWPYWEHIASQGRWKDTPPIFKSWIESDPANRRLWELTRPGRNTDYQLRNCPFSTNNHGFGCTVGPTSVSNNSTTTTIPAEYDSQQNRRDHAGLICPSRDTGSRWTSQQQLAQAGVVHDRYYNGCWNSRPRPEIQFPVAQWYKIRVGSDATCGNGLSSEQCSCFGNTGSSHRFCALDPQLNWGTNARGSTSTCPSGVTTNGEDADCKSVDSKSSEKRLRPYDHFWRPAEHPQVPLAERQSPVNVRATPQPAARWTGCVRDRLPNHDVSDTTPTSAATKFQPVQAGNCEGSSSLASIMPLTNDWAELDAKVDAMNTGGGTSGTRYTNITIGLAWGWHALFNNDPLSQGSEPKDDLDKVIILMTDGDNTRSGWSTSVSNIDARTELACENFKALKGSVPSGIKLYTIRVMDGNEALLRKCASETDMYYNVQQASQLNAVFSTIAKNLASLRIAK